MLGKEHEMLEEREMSQELRKQLSLQGHRILGIYFREWQTKSFRVKQTLTN